MEYASNEDVLSYVLLIAHIINTDPKGELPYCIRQLYVYDKLTKSDFIHWLISINANLQFYSNSDVKFIKDFFVSDIGISLLNPRNELIIRINKLIFNINDMLNDKRKHVSK